METKNLNKVLNNGSKMPFVGLGTALGYDEEIRKAVRKALEVGYRSIDTAYFYLNEEVIGAEIQEWLNNDKIKREELFITSKLPAIGNRPEDVDKFLTKSLEKLKLQYLDLYLIHHPFGLKGSDDNDLYAKDSSGKCVLDHDTDLESIWKALEKQVDNGRIKSIGVSNFNSNQIDRIMKVAKYPPAVNQIEVHCYLQQNSLVEKCQKLGITIVGYCPLGAPFSTEGKNISPPLLKNPVVEDIGKKYGKNAAQVLLRFLVQRDIIVIPKSVTPERITSNFNLMDFTLNKEDMDALSKLDRGEEARVCHFKVTFPGSPNHKEYPFH